MMKVVGDENWIAEKEKEKKKERDKQRIRQKSERSLQGRCRRIRRVCKRRRRSRGEWGGHVKAD
jgi:hypothetical protein